MGADAGQPDHGGQHGLVSSSGAAPDALGRTGGPPAGHRPPDGHRRRSIRPAYAQKGHASPVALAPHVPPRARSPWRPATLRSPPPAPGRSGRRRARGGRRGPAPRPYRRRRGGRRVHPEVRPGRPDHDPRPAARDHRRPRADRPRSAQRPRAGVCPDRGVPLRGGDAPRRLRVGWRQRGAPDAPRGPRRHLRAGRAGSIPLDRPHVRRPRPGGRRARHRAVRAPGGGRQGRRCHVGGGSHRRHQRGVPDRRCPGRRGHGLRHGDNPPGRRHRRPRQCLCGRGEAPGQRGRRGGLGLRRALGDRRRRRPRCAARVRRHRSGRPGRARSRRPGLAGDVGRSPVGRGQRRGRPHRGGLTPAGRPRIHARHRGDRLPRRRPRATPWWSPTRSLPSTSRSW